MRRGSGLKGIGLLLLSNILIFVTLSITFTILVNIVLPMFGMDIRGSVNQTVLLWSFVLGFGGAFASLLMSKRMVRMMMRMTRITSPRTAEEQMIFNTVQELSRPLGIKMPEVWVYEAPDPNAFATGPSKNNAMVAVSTGLLQNLNEKEVRAVLAHEMGHVFNGDMFTTTILAGLMNTFVYFISNMASRHVAERNPMLGFAVYFFLQIVLSFLAMIPICWFSRRREFAADEFAAKRYGSDAMIGALRSIQRFVEGHRIQYSTKDAMATMKISGNTKGWLHLFATHPPIESRVARLEWLGGQRASQ
ncbi:MAG TPA: protease HtpX [Nitrospiria bacterium]